MDEFCSTLDRDTAKIVAYDIQKHARKEDKAVLATTTHTDLLENLAPTIHIHKRFGKEITVTYHSNKPYINNENLKNTITNVDSPKLAKALPVLSILLQGKVYLFWTHPKR